MQEDFLHYVWQFQKVSTQTLLLEEKEPLQVIQVGLHNTEVSGPDFLNATLLINTIKWVGHVEVHLKSSDWNVHKHQLDPAYNAVILHVVWEHDCTVFRQDGSKLPTLVLSEWVSKPFLEKYTKWQLRKSSFLLCKPEIHKVDSTLFNAYKERLFISRLESKTSQVLQLLEYTKGDWEAVLFMSLASALGAKINTESFLSIAQSVSFKIVRKIHNKPCHLEALLLGQAGLLKRPLKDSYQEQLHETYTYLAGKFSLNQDGVIAPKFFRLRPSSFPTIRLSQLAEMYKRASFFELLMQANTFQDICKLFKVPASTYWHTHYVFGKESTFREKVLTNTRIALLVLNAILPIKMAYQKEMGKPFFDNILALADTLPPEKNKYLSTFIDSGIKVANAKESQALIELYKHYCLEKKCLQCSIGHQILK